VVPGGKRRRRTERRRGRKEKKKTNVCMSFLRGDSEEGKGAVLSDRRAIETAPREGATGGVYVGGGGRGIFSDSHQSGLNVTHQSRCIGWGGGVHIIIMYARIHTQYMPRWETAAGRGDPSPCVR
jgi:hypothetical protein